MTKRFLLPLILLLFASALWAQQPVNIQSDATIDLDQLAGIALASPTSYGTAPTGSVLGVNAYITNNPSILQAQPSRTTGTITTSSSTVSAATTGYASATVTVNGTYAGVTVNFEFSDDGGTTWYPFQCARVDAAIQESSEALGSNVSRAWDCGIYASSNFRVRSSAYTSGTANIGITLSAAAIEPAPTVSGSGTFSVNQSQVGGTNVVADPCQANAKSYAVVNMSSATTTRIIAPVSAKHTYICSMILMASAADNVVIEEGTGGTCGTGTAGIAGDTTTGLALGANGGFVMGDGLAAVMATAGTNVDFCLKTSSAAQLSGHVAYVQQ